MNTNWSNVSYSLGLVSIGPTVLELRPFENFTLVKVYQGQRSCSIFIGIDPTIHMDLVCLNQTCCCLRSEDAAARWFDGKLRKRINIHRFGFSLRVPNSLLVGLQACRHLSWIKRRSTLEPIGLSFSILLLSKEFADLLCKCNLLQLIAEFHNQLQADGIMKQS